MQVVNQSNSMGSSLLFVLE